MRTGMSADTGEVDLGALERAFESLADDGGTAAIVVRRGDECLLNLAAGRDAGGRVFTSATPVFLYSAVKPVAALTVLHAVADGHLRLEATVASLWPAFAVHGKDGITIRDALAHSAAVPGWRQPLRLAELADRASALHSLATSPPWWRPGEPGEHATSYGHLLDGILTHGTGRDIEAWWDEVATSGIRIRLRPDPADAPWPLSDRDDSWRTSWSSAPGVMGELLRNPPELLDVEAVNSAAVRGLVAPAVTGYGSADDLSLLWTWWTSDAAAERLGRRLRDASLATAVSGHDHVLDRPVAWGLGPQIDEESVGMGGIGGSFGLYLTRPGLSVGFATADVSPVGRADVLDAALDELARVDAI